VDYENVGHIDLAALPPDIRVVVFFGASQRKVPTALLKTVAQLGERFDQVDIHGQGKNALDFHIAFYLGQYLTTSSTTRCVILSKDTGFDPLVQHLQGRKLSVQRVSTLPEAFADVEPTASVITPSGTVVPTPKVVLPPTKTAATSKAVPMPMPMPKTVPAAAAKAAPNAKQIGPLSPEQVVHWLKGTKKNKRPRKRKSLVAHLHSHFGQKMPESEIQSLVDRLISGKKLTVTNGAVTYHF